MRTMKRMTRVITIKPQRKKPKMRFGPPPARDVLPKSAEAQRKATAQDYAVEKRTGRSGAPHGAGVTNVTTETRTGRSVVSNEPTGKRGTP
jgi:hypothetical protein